MACALVKLPDRLTAIVCRSRRPQRRCACKRPATLLCDWKVGHGKTCDRPICTSCAQEVAADKHLCPEHQAAYRQWCASYGRRA